MEGSAPIVHAVAAELSLSIVRPLAGGEFGATLVTDADQRDMVLKVLQSPGLAPRFAEGAELALRLVERGYPAPRYYGTGATREVAWSLQEVLPGHVPQSVTMAHARKLVELAGMHAGAAGRSSSWRDETIDRMRKLSRRLAESPEARELAAELGQLIEVGAEAELLDDGIVHGDFHHRNYLAIGDEVTGVFDWELASVGDWRADLVTLAFWSSIITEQVPRNVASYLTNEFKSRCPAPSSRSS